MKMMNKEQYENLIALMKEALSFYADENNYGEYQQKKINIDNGSQARFTLKKVQETLDMNKKMEDDYNKVIGETISAIENHKFNIGDIISKIKNVEKNGDKI